MKRHAKAKPSLNTPRGVRWTPEEWERIQAAVKALSDRHEIRAAASDVIRSGTLRRVEEILGAA